MKPMFKLKFWPLIFVGLVCLFGTILPFADRVVRSLAETLTQIVGTVLPGVLTAAYTTVAPLLRPLFPITSSHTEVVLRIGLGIVAVFTGAGVLTELAWLLRRRHRQRPDTWICHACSAGDHQQCRGALFFVSRAREGARACECKHCALNR
jgi:hypothetical protein